LNRFSSNQFCRPALSLSEASLDRRIRLVIDTEVRRFVSTFCERNRLRKSPRTALPFSAK
jgi:hypothetical protein